MRRSHFVKANHSTQLPLRMIWVDTEAVNEEGQIGAGVQRLTFGVAIYERYADKDSRNHVESDRIRFTDPEAFWVWVQSKTDPKSVTWVMAHNWNYDAGILNTSVNLPSLGYELGKYINGKPPLIVTWKNKGANLKMVDTLNYFPGSVSSIGKSVGLPKLEMPAPNASVSDWDDYAWRDVEVIRLAFLGLRDFIREQDLGVMQSTLASQAMNAYRHRFMPERLLCHDNEKALELERESLHGGRTEAFWRGEVEGPLYKLDVNSHYPAVMQSEPLGFHLEHYFATFNQPWWDKARRENKSIVARVLLKTDEPAYGLVHDEKLVFPVGTFWSVLTTPEIDYAVKHNHIVKVGEFAIHKRAVLFKDYIEHFYGLRLEYKRAGNATMDYMSKGLINSLFGKWGQNGRKWKETDLYDWPLDWPTSAEGYIELDEKQKNDNNLRSLEKEEIVRIRQRLGKVQVLETEGESENSIPLISSEITAYGRIRLWEFIRRAGVENVYYVDTDSLITNQVGYERLQDEIHPTRLGALKLEETLKSGRFSAPKDYSLWEGIPYLVKDTIKGVRKYAVKIDEDTYSQEQFQSWDKNLKEGYDGSITVRKTVKRLSRKNTKRVIIGEDMLTQPLEINTY